MLDMAGTAQQDLHPARPIFLFDLEQCFKFAQVTRVAKRVLNALHGVVRLPVVMPHNAADTTQHVTAIDADAVVGQPSRGRDMQPLQSFDDAKPGLVEVLDWGEQDQLTHRLGDVSGGENPRLNGAYQSPRSDLEPSSARRSAGAVINRAAARPTNWR